MTKQEKLLNPRVSRLGLVLVLLLDAFLLGKYILPRGLALARSIDRKIHAAAWTAMNSSYPVSHYSQNRNWPRLRDS
jgi:hypothetical protein